MKKLLLLCVIMFNSIQLYSFAPGSLPATNIFYPVSHTPNVISLHELLHLSPKKYRQLTGKRMTFKEKLAFLIIKNKLKQGLPEATEKKGNTAGGLSALFGIVALLTLVGISSPVIGFISILSAIAAVVLGVIGLKRNKKDTRAWIGLIIGGAYLLLFLIFLITIDFGYK